MWKRTAAKLCGGLNLWICPPVVLTAIANAAVVTAGRFKQSELLRRLGAFSRVENMLRRAIAMLFDFREPLRQWRVVCFRGLILRTLGGLLSSILMEKTLGAARPDSERLVRYCCKKMTNRFVLMLAVWLATFTSMAQIVINEIHYSPDVKTELVEFIELYNAGNAPVNLSGWQLTNAVAFTIPNGTTLAAGGDLVGAANPAAVAAKFGVSALGPWVGSLNGDGEKIELRNAAGGSEDEVSYQLGFPWPTVGDPPGYSIELVNPAFDNDLGGNWRASVSSNPATVSRTMISTGATWRYFNGVTEASSPTTAWRQGGFDESSWLQGAAPIGYDEVLPMGTGLSNMQSNFTTVFFRNSFVITNTAEISYLP